MPQPDFVTPPLLRAHAPGPLRQALRRRLAADQILVLPGAVDALTATLIAQIGFDACYVTGAGVANAEFGIADVGLTTQTEIVERARRICASVRLPVVVDADTGYGNALSVMRTVAELERAGAAAIQLEDQVTPKRCGHFPDKEVIPTIEMTAKIQAACEARSDPDLMLIARTDAIESLGFEEALARGRAYRDAGADVVFVEAPRTIEELVRIPKEVSGVLHVVNVVEGGVTPVLRQREYESLGYRVILYANLALRAAIFAARRALENVYEDEHEVAIHDGILEWTARQDLVHLSAILNLNDRYLMSQRSTQTDGKESVTVE